MKFHTHVPKPELARFVDHFWFVHSTENLFPRQTLFPDGGITILFNLGDPHNWIDRITGERKAYRDAWISGERLEPYLLETVGTTHIAGIRFRPGGARPFLPIPARELTGLVIPLDQVFGQKAKDCHVQLHDAPTPHVGFRVLERFLEDVRRHDWAKGDRLVGAAIREINQLGPSASIVQLAKSLGTSHRQLLRQFDTCVGLKPKMLQRIVRFQRAIGLEDAARNLDWSTIAYRCGYYDQAHLIRDFKILSSVTPKKYRALRLEYPNYVPEL